MSESSSSEDVELGLGGVEVDRDVVAVQQVRARAYSKLFGEELPPPRIGRFEVLREVGHGGMGVVHAAYDPQLQRNVALKVLRRRGRDRDARGQARLLREARAAARLSHPNVVTVYEVGEERGAIHIAMELLDAVTLRQHVATIAGDWRAIVSAYLAAGRGLDAAHTAGIVHRDFKPDNVLVATDGRICVTDFGLARAAEDDADASADPPSSPTVDDDATFGVAGTVPYMAPEQLRGETPGAAADQFAYCVALWEALFGRRPFAGTTPAELRDAIERGAIEVGTDDMGVPSSVRAACRRGLAAAPQARHLDMAALLRELAAAIEPRRSAWTWTIAAVCIAAMAGFAWWQQPRACTGAHEQLAAVWNPARREQLGARLVATALPFAVDVARELDAQLESYATAWTTTHEAVCTATRIRGEVSERGMDRSMACLSDRLARFDATLRVLEGAEPEVVESALAVSAVLPSIAACAGADARPGAIGLPEDPDARARVQEQIAALEHAVALRRAGRPHQSARALAELDLVVRETAHAPLSALLRVEQAETALALAEIATATQAADEALELAASARELDVLAQASVTQAAVALQAGDLVAARAVIRAARIAVATAGDPPRWRARLLQLDSRTAYAAGDLERALASGLAALEIVTTAQGERSLDAAEAVHVVAAAHHARGDYAAAAEHNERARAIRETLLGTHHPLVADSWANLGGSWLALGDLDGAQDCFARALAIRTRALGADHPAVADLLLNQGGIAARRGDLPAAQADFERALTILEARLGREHLRVIPALLNLAGVAIERGRIDRAHELATRGLAMLTAAHGDAHPSIAIALGHLAEVARQRGEGERAVELLTRALAIRQKALGETHPHLATTLQALAAAELAVGRTADAQAHAEQALALQNRAAAPSTGRSTPP